MVLESLNTGDPLVQVGVALTILVFGHLSVKLLNSGIRRFWTSSKKDLTKKEIEERNEALRYFSYVLDSGVIIFVLMYLNTGINSGLFTQVIEFIPQLVSTILVVILGFLAINITTKVGSDFIKTLGVESYFREVGLSRSALNLFAGVLKGFLYLLLLQISLTQLGIGNTFVDELVRASSWAAAFVIAGLIFYGFKDIFQNYAAGIYLQNSRQVRPGEEVELEGEMAEVRNVSLFSTILNTQSGKTVVTPNKKLMNSNISLKRTKSDLDTLEDIKSYFVAEEPEYAGPASIVMGLEIFGYRAQQKDIAERIDDESDPEQVKKAIEDLTDEDVRAAFIEHEKITDISAEFKTWFNDGALTLVEIEKGELFPESEEAHHLLCVGAEENEILVIDPGSAEGGVYYVDKEKLYSALDKSENPGYTVMAPNGTTAYWRIKNGLIYSDKNYYDELSKTLESRLTKIMRQGRILKKSMPSELNKYIEKWRKEGDVTRLWSPEDED